MLVSMLAASVALGCSHRMLERPPEHPEPHEYPLCDESYIWPSLDAVAAGLSGLIAGLGWAQLDDSNEPGGLVLLAGYWSAAAMAHGVVSLKGYGHARACRNQRADFHWRVRAAETRSSAE